MDCTATLWKVNPKVEQVITKLKAMIVENNGSFKLKTIYHSIKINIHGRQMWFFHSVLGDKGYFSVECY